MENRLEILRNTIDTLIKEKQPGRNRDFIIHLYGVSHFCTLLALRRNLNVELATTSGMLHDIYQIVPGIMENHAVEGAKQAEILLKDLKLYSKDEIAIIVTAISRHSNKSIVEEPYDEILKDADVLSHCLYNVDFEISEKEAARYKNLLIELGCETVVSA